MPVSWKNVRNSQRLLADFLLTRRKIVSPMSIDLLEQIRQWRALPWRKEILGLGYGPKRVSQKGTKQLALKIFVAKKVDESRLTTSSIVPTSFDLTKFGLGVIPTDVEEIGEVPMAHGVGPGSQIAHFVGTEGTMGLFVRRSGSTEIFYLSCSHVLARSGFATANDEVESPLDADSTRALNLVGRLVPNGFSKLRANLVNPCDAALATVVAPPEPPPPGFPNPVLFRELTNADLIQNPARKLTRFGFKTGIRPGTTMGAIGAFPIANLPGFGSTPVVIDNLIPYTTSSAAGDSGAAVVDVETGRVIGIHIAGTSTVGFALSIKAIKDELGITPAN